jgi:hypothetical protein
MRKLSPVVRDLGQDKRGFEVFYILEADVHVSLLIFKSRWRDVEVKIKIWGVDASPAILGLGRTLKL